MHILRLLKALLIFVFLLSAAASSAEVPLPDVQLPEGICVEPTDAMRKNHMEFILHQRDETMEQGIRTSKHSLKQCISCHAVKDDQGEYVHVDDSRHFCASCHEYAAVSIDCFQCHADTPRSTDKHELRVNE
ncbi:MAG: Hdr-like menaquinol oxidoreductase cytochrome c subunit [Arenicellales bacterium]